MGDRAAHHRRRGFDPAISLRTAAGGAVADTATCSFPFPFADFKGTPGACELATTAAYDSIQTILSWTGATTASLLRSTRCR